VLVIDRASDVVEIPHFMHPATSEFLITSGYAHVLREFNEKLASCGHMQRARAWGHGAHTTDRLHARAMSHAVTKSTFDAVADDLEAALPK
jgi:hypothetical protein